MTSKRSSFSALQAGALIAALNLVCAVYAFSVKPAVPADEICRIYAAGPGFDTPIFIAARTLQFYPLESPLLRFLSYLNLPALVVSAPIYGLLFRTCYPSSLVLASYLYAFLLATLVIVQWLLAARFFRWLFRTTQPRNRPSPA